MEENERKDDFKMTERMKILQMLSEGKVTPEQAESLLAAIERPETKRGPKFLDKSALSDLKNIGQQVSAAVSQSLTDARRALEGQLDVFSLSNSSTVSVTHDLSLPLNIQRIHLQTTNGAIQVSTWDEPYVQIHIRAKARTNNLTDARRALQSALQVQEQDNLYDLTIVHGDKDQENGGHIVGAQLDVSIPKFMKDVALRSQNGRIVADGITVPNIHLETSNGQITFFRSSGERVSLVSVNGAIEVLQGLSGVTRQLNVEARNGSITVEGLPQGASFSGRAHTSLGKVDISDPRFEVVYEDSLKRGNVRFETKKTPDAEDGVVDNLPEVRLQLETRNGSIRIKP